MAIGEAGSLVSDSGFDGDPITVTFEQPLTDPVIALSATNAGGNPFVLRVVDQVLDANGDTVSFTFWIEEWEYLDGSHTFETINWIAVEAGVHELPDGRIIEAGTTTASGSGSHAVSLSGGFGAPPVVLTSVMSDNDTTTVDSDPLNITASGFDIQLQEEEAEADNHGSETVGWIAIQGGGDGSSGTAATFGGVDENVDVLSLGATFTDGIVVVETQTINGGDPADLRIASQTDSTVGVFVQEETSNDGETGHVNETVGVVAFEDGLILCFAAGTGINVPGGMRPVEDLAVGDFVETVDGGVQPVRWIGVRQVSMAERRANPKLNPIRITAGALGAGVPARDLLLSRQHRVLVSSRIAERMFGARDVLVAAGRLVDLPGVFEDAAVEEVAYVHVLLDGHHLLFAEGAPAESLYLGQSATAMMTPEGRAEVFGIFPELAGRTGAPEPVRFIPTGARQRALVARHVKNEKPCLRSG